MQPWRTDLHAFIARADGVPMPPAAAAAIMADVAGGLAHLHAQQPKLAHCDLTPRKVDYRAQPWPKTPPMMPHPPDPCASTAQVVGAPGGRWRLSDFSSLTETAGARGRVEELVQKRGGASARESLVRHAPEVLHLGSGLTIDEQLDVRCHRAHHGTALSPLHAPPRVTDCAARWCSVPRSPFARIAGVVRRLHPLRAAHRDAPRLQRAARYACRHRARR